MIAALWLVALTLIGLALVVIPGWLILRAWLPSYLAWGCGPGLTLAVIATVALVAPKLATNFNYLTAAGLFFALLLVSELLSLLANRKFGHKTAIRKHRLRASAISFSRADRIGIAAGMLIAYLPAAFAIRGANQPAQAWDAVFHQSAIAVMRENDNISSIGGLEFLMGRPGLYYPTGAEAWASLIPGNPIAAYNAATLAILLAFPLVVATLTKTLIPRAAYAVGLTAFIAGGIKSFTALTTLVAVLGYCAGMITGCAALALLIYLVKNRFYSTIPLVAFFIFATAIVHGSAAFGLLVAGTPLVIFGWVDLCRNVLPSRWKPLGWFLGTLVLLGGPLFTYLARRPLSAVFHYQRPSLSPAAGLSEWPADIASVAATPLGLYGSVFVAILGVFGYAVWATGRTRLDPVIGICLFISLAITVVLVIVSMGPENILRVLTAPWYRQGARLGALSWVLTLIGVAVALRYLERRWDARQSLGQWLKTAWVKGPIWLVVLALLATATPITQAVSRYDVVARTYRPEIIRWGTMATSAQLQLINEAAANPSWQGAVILADPKMGGTLFANLGWMKTLYPQLHSQAPKPYRELIKVLKTSPNPEPAAVCAAIGDISFVYKVDEGAKTTREGMKATELQPLINRIPDSLLTPVLTSSDGAVLASVNCPSAS